MKLLNIKNDVQALLSKSEACRESDTRLIVSIWAKFLGEAKIDKMSATDLLNMFSENKLPNPESIRRVRQRLQETNPYLRGKNYQNRQDEQETVVNELKEIS